ncbi:MAG: transposase, partial [Ruminococcaceae bacterium]|nr:transposase [Oscillospiraceae bacterium]
TLKTEMTDIRHLGYEEAKQEILSYIYLYYNSERLHSGIGYKTPNSVWM